MCKEMLFLDDVRNPNDEYIKRSIIGRFDGDIIWVKDAVSFVKHINTHGLPNVISFDHDLGGDFSGYDCAKFLVEYCIDNRVKLPEFIVH